MNLPTDGKALAEGKKEKKGLLGWISAALLAIAKFFKPILLLLGKFKFLLLGLKSLSTIFSMLAFFGVYWATYGWQWALGIVLVIYVHEMGHVQALKHYGINAGAPMFIPFLGAFVRLKEHPPTEEADARTGLAGPTWGLYATLACYGLYLATGIPILQAIGHSSAFINLFNLIPVWQLDGSRGFASLSQYQRLVLAMFAAMLAFFLHEGFLWAIALIALIRGIKPGPPERDDLKGALIYAGLLLSLGFLAGYESLDLPSV
jgi:Zn-dependent protease